MGEKVWRRFEKRFGGGARDGLAEVRERRLGEDSRETAWRRFEIDGLANIRERRLGEDSRETAWRKFERDGLVAISMSRCKDKWFIYSDTVTEVRRLWK